MALKLVNYRQHTGLLRGDNKVLLKCIQITSLEIVQTIGCLRKTPHTDGLDRKTGKIASSIQGFTENP